ncbi:unnamed protein product [Discula destructiva]
MPDSSVYVALLLETVKTRQKIPRECVDALEDIGRASDSSTERIFYDHGGLAAWAAYSITKKVAMGSGHIAGRKKRRELVERMEAETAARRKSLAIEVAAAIDTDRERLEDIINTARLHRQSTLPKDDSDTGITLGSEREAHSESTIAAEESDAPDNVSPDTHHLAGASTAGCRHVFSRYLVGALKKAVDGERANGERANGELLPRVAAVNLALRDYSESEMRLEIMDNKVECIARELFDAHLVTANGTRYLCLTGSTRVVPNPSMVLAGCRPPTLSRIFGQRIADALMSTTVYRRDFEEGRERTDCVTMEIFQAANATALLRIPLPADDAWSIKDELYS